MSLDTVAAETVQLLTDAGFANVSVRILGNIRDDMSFEGYVWATVPPHPSHPSSYYDEFTRAARTAFEWVLERHQISFAHP